MVPRKIISLLGTTTSYLVPTIMVCKWGIFLNGVIFRICEREMVHENHSAVEPIQTCHYRSHLLVSTQQVKKREVDLRSLLPSVVRTKNDMVVQNCGKIS